MQFRSKFSPTSKWFCRFLFCKLILRYFLSIDVSKFALFLPQKWITDHFHSNFYYQNVKKGEGVRVMQLSCILMQQSLMIDLCKLFVINTQKWTIYPYDQIIVFLLRQLNLKPFKSRGNSCLPYTKSGLKIWIIFML